MTQLNLAIESGIRDHPEQYLWMHDRWKSARRAGLLADYIAGQDDK
jgi:KDO2-lipid IV(A) lauroyltransferase